MKTRNISKVIEYCEFPVRNSIWNTSGKNSRGVRTSCADPDLHKVRIFSPFAQLQKFIKSLSNPNHDEYFK